MKTTDNDNDRALRRMMQQLPEAPASPWFTKKVLNRLPDKQKRIAARIELWSCAIAAAITLVLGIKYCAGTMTGPVITIGDIAMYCVYLAIFGALTANMLIPVITNRARRNL